MSASAIFGGMSIPGNGVQPCSILELAENLTSAANKLHAMTHSCGGTKLNLQGVALEMYQLDPDGFDCLPPEDVPEVISLSKRVYELQKQIDARCHTGGRHRCLTLDGVLLYQLYCAAKGGRPLAS